MLWKNFKGNRVTAGIKKHTVDSGFWSNSVLILLPVSGDKNPKYLSPSPHGSSGEDNVYPVREKNFQCKTEKKRRSQRKTTREKKKQTTNFRKDLENAGLLDGPQVFDNRKVQGVAVCLCAILLMLVSYSVLAKREELKRSKVHTEGNTKNTTRGRKRKMKKGRTKRKLDGEGRARIYEKGKDVISGTTINT